MKFKITLLIIILSLLSKTNKNIQDVKGMKAHLKQVVRTYSGKLSFLLMGRCAGVGTLLLGMNVDVMNTISGWE
jgi:hypothetical protein